MALRNPVYFVRSYDEMRELRRLPAYELLRQSTADDYRRIEIDYVEVALSARHYDEADTLAQHILRATRDPSLRRIDQLFDTRRVNAALFAYIARALQADEVAAASRLDDLESVVNGLPPQFDNKWEYPGTERFIQTSDAPASLKQALLALCARHASYASEMLPIIAQNRRALSTLNPR